MSTFYPEHENLSAARPLPVTTTEMALRGVVDVIDELDAQRKALTRLYAGAPSHSSIEHEIGESLTLVRKALARLRKARLELAQQELPLN